jgi:hypothetical protein
MARRPDPERIYAAERSAVVQRLIGEGELPERAEARVSAWESTTAADGKGRDGDYWVAAWRWLLSEETAGRLRP